MDGGALARMSSDAAGLVTRSIFPDGGAIGKYPGNLYTCRDGLHSRHVDGSRAPPSLEAQMSNLVTASADRRAITTAFLTSGTRVATALAVLVAQVGLAIPAVLNGLFQQDLHTTSSQLTWISDAFLVPVTLLELSFGVLGDLFGRKRLLIGGSLLMVVGEVISVLTPGVGASNHAAIGVLWTGQVLTGVGAAVLFPTSLAMVAAGTHTVKDRAKGISFWAAALSTGAFLSPLLGGL